MVIGRRMFLKVAGAGLLTLPAIHFRPFFLVSTAEAGKEKLFRQSDVFSYTWGNKRIYRDYRVDYVAWGRIPKFPVNTLKAYRKRINTAGEAGVRVILHMGTRTWWQGFIEYLQIRYGAYAAYKMIQEAVCCTLSGEPIIIPPQLHKKYKGYPAYWFCTNNFHFSAYRKEMLKKAASEKTLGFMVDDPLGTAATIVHGGCYCNACMLQFKAHLAKHFSKEELMEKGITNIEHFNLKVYHEASAHVPPSARPFAAEFLSFQKKKAKEVYDELRRILEKEAGHKRFCSANIAPTTRSGRHFIETIDYFCCEIPMGAADGSVDWPANRGRLIYKLADGLGKPAVVMGDGRDHAYIAEHHLPGMIRCWIAEAYAHGHYFMAPYRLWTSNGRSGGYGFYKPQDSRELAPFFRFIKENNMLFDGFENPRVPYALVFCLKAYHKRPNEVLKEIGPVFQSRSLFDLLVVDDNDRVGHLTDKKLEPYHVVYLPKLAEPGPEDRAALKRYEQSGGEVVCSWEEIKSPFDIEISGNGLIRFAFRKLMKNGHPEYVLHLLNKDYSKEIDACVIKNNVTVYIPGSMLGFRVRQADYYQPERMLPKQDKVGPRRHEKVTPVSRLQFELTQTGVRISIPRLDVWGIVSLG